MTRTSLLLTFASVVAFSGIASAEALSRQETPKTAAFEFKLGGYKPLMDDAPGLTDPKPYQTTFGAGAMLLLELETDYQLWQKIGSLGVGFSIGYAEKYGAALVTKTGQPAGERTSLKVLPLHLMGVYRFDYAALNYILPLVPYVKAGLVYTPWWMEKGGHVEYFEGVRAVGGRWGYSGTLGLSLMLDFLEPRLARDFDSDMGVNHSYFFAEYVHENVNNFGLGGSSATGSTGLDLSSRRWMFGLTLEY